MAKQRTIKQDVERLINFIEKTIGGDLVAECIDPEITEYDMHRRIAHVFEMADRSTSMEQCERYKLVLDAFWCLLVDVEPTEGIHAGTEILEWIYNHGIDEGFELCRFIAQHEA